jgi:hypothetical protein
MGGVGPQTSFVAALRACNRRTSATSATRPASDRRLSLTVSSGVGAAPIEGAGKVDHGDVAPRSFVARVEGALFQVGGSAPGAAAPFYCDNACESHTTHHRGSYGRLPKNNGVCEL